MNIRERFYCSRCLKELEDEGVCDECHYDPTSEPVENALDEGTLLGNGRIQIGAVRQCCRLGFIYGGYDYLKEKPIFIFEFFPRDQSVRRNLDGIQVQVLNSLTAGYETGKQQFEGVLEKYCTLIRENNTFYAME